MSRRQLGSVAEISPGVWRIQVSAGIHPVTGQRVRMTRVIRGTERDAEAMLAQLLLEAGKTPETEVTVKQYLEQMYLPHAESRVRARSYDGYKSKLEFHVIPVLGAIPLAELTPFQLDKWMDGVKGSDRSRLHVYRVFCTALNLAVRWRLIDHNPIHAITPPKVERQQPQTLSAKEAQAYLAAFKGHVIEPIVVLALACGLRRSELAALQWHDIDFANKSVSITKGHHDRGGKVLVEKTKSVTSNRIVALPDWAVAILEPMRALGPLVIEDGKAMRPRRISDLYLEHVNAKELRYLPLKNLRHTHATLMLEAGVDLYTVSRRLGHSTTAVTQMHYVKPSQDADKAAADAFSRLLQPVPSPADAKVTNANDVL